MVYLDRLYTRGGDAGQTGLGDGSRIAKSHPRIAAIGAVDELNSALGVALSHPEMPVRIRDALTGVQNDLFDLGADLAVPLGSDAQASLRITDEQVAELERRIDAGTASLTPLTSFILPGGTPVAAALHLARAICRRAEVAMVQLTEAEPTNPRVLAYLNRLSDLLFAVARLANDGGRSDVLWKPGGG